MIGSHARFLFGLVLMVPTLAWGGSGGSSSDGTRAGLSGAQTIPRDNLATLTELAESGLVDALSDRLAGGADPNALDHHSRTPLQAGAKAGQAAAVARLLAAGADPNLDPPDSSGQPLCLAARRKSPEHVEVVRLLLNNGARPNDKCVQGYGPTPLMRAAEVGNTNAVQLLLAAGADVNAVDWSPTVMPRHDTTALMYAAQEGQAEAVKLLLEAGAAVNAEMLPCGWTSLWLAADTRGGVRPDREEDYAATARELLRHGADVSAAPPSDLRTPLLVAAQVNSAMFVHVLLEFRADPNVRDTEGQTALMHAAKRGDVMMVEALLEKGADRAITDKYGRTAQQLAAMLGFSDVSRLLASPAAVEGGAKDLQVRALPGEIAAEPAPRSASWQFQVPGRISGGPYITGDVVVVGWQQVVYGLDAATGRQLWTLDATGRITAPPRMFGDVLYLGETGGGAAGNGPGIVYALEPRTGERSWSREFRAGIRHLLPGNSGLFVQTGDGELHAIDLLTGSSIWQANMGSGASMEPVIAGDILVVVAGDGDLRGIDGRTGRTLWQAGFSQPDLGASQFHQRVLEAVASEATREQLRSTPVDALYPFGASICDGLGQRFTEQEWEENLAEMFGNDLARALVQVAQVEICPPGTAHERIAALRRGAENAARGITKVATAPVVGASGQIFVQVGQVDPQRTVVGLDPLSGTATLSIPLRGFGTNPPTLGGSSVFVQDGDNLVAFDLTSQARRWALDLQSQTQGGAYRPTTIFHQNRLYLDGKTVIAVDAATGSVSWRGGRRLENARLLGAADGILFCRTATGEYYVGVDPDSGTVHWVTSTRNDLEGSLVIGVPYSAGMFVHAAGGHVFAVRTVEDGQNAP